MADLIPLPEPSLDGPRSLEDVLHKRRSVRAFASRPIEETEISQLLWSAQGITERHGKRAAPSAGALYPLDLLLVSTRGLYRYMPKPHALRLVRQEDLRANLSRACLEQEFIAQAPISVVICADFSITAGRYGRERSPRYVHLEVGHAAQNLMLQATALGIGSVLVGAFSDRQVSEVLDLPRPLRALAVIPLGYPQ